MSGLIFLANFYALRAPAAWLYWPRDACRQVCQHDTYGGDGSIALPITQRGARAALAFGSFDVARGAGCDSLSQRCAHCNQNWPSLLLAALCAWERHCLICCRIKGSAMLTEGGAAF